MRRQSFFVWLRKLKYMTQKMKKAIVVGATSGIGLEVARLLAKRGYKVGVAGRRVERLAEAVKSTEGIVAYRQIDVNDENAPIKLRELIAELGGMDLYFHSSGIGWENCEFDIDREMKTVETNAVGFTRMVSAAYRWLADNNKEGRIACITSIARTRGLGAAPAYSATKRFQSHYLECLSQQARMRGLKIRVTDIRPGFVATDLIAGSHFPLQLSAESVARTIVKAIEHGKEIVTIDWRYRLLVAAWSFIPRWMWIRIKFAK